jgi:hypothetical protein
MIYACPAMAAKIGNAFLKFGLLMLPLEGLGIHAWRRLDDRDGPTATTEREKIHQFGSMQIWITFPEINGQERNRTR